MQDVHGQHAALPGLGVDGHLGAGRAIGEVEERPAREGGLVVVDLGRAVEAVAPQLDAVGIGLLDHVLPAPRGRWGHDLPALEAHGPGAAAVQPGDEGCQVVADGARRVLRRAAVQVGAAAGGGGAGVGHLAGVAGGDQHAGQRHAQLVGHDLRHLGVQALAHLGAAVVDLHAAIRVDVHQRAGLVEQRGREADAELDGRERQAALEHGALRVPGRNGLLPLPVLRGLLQLR